MYEFTPRETQIAIRFLKGEKRAAIADALNLHVRTVDYHLGNLRRKVRVNSMVELAVSLARLNGALKH